jgi:hypothetical protein
MAGHAGSHPFLNCRNLSAFYRSDPSGLSAGRFLSNIVELKPRKPDRQTLLTTWLHGLNVRAWFSTPVVRASLGTKCGGMKLQSCRKIENLLAVGLTVVSFSCPTLWQSTNPQANLFLHLNPQSREPTVTL